MVGVPGAGGTQSYRPSSTRGHSTWEPDPSRVVWQRLCERPLAEKAVCCHADIQRIYSTRNGEKSVDVSKEEDNGEGGIGGRWLHPGAGDRGHTITLHDAGRFGLSTARKFENLN